MTAPANNAARRRGWTSAQGRGARGKRWRYPYAGGPETVPHPRQAIAHGTWADELLYGGAAGGGKSDYLLGECVTACLEHPGLNVAIFRRTFTDLSRPSGIIHRLLSRIPTTVARYNATTHQFRFVNGSILEIGAIEREADVLKYQGAEYGLVAFDELTQFTEYQYLYLLGRLRVSGELAEAGYRPRAIAAANPGGPGHGWVKGRFIDPAPPFITWRPKPTEEDPNPGLRVFVPAKVTDNPSVDAHYINRLNALPEDDRRALRDGDWDVYAGQRFRQFRRDRHVIAPEELPLSSLIAYPRAVGVDYGLDAPFAALWGARLNDGLVVVYRELYAPGLTPREQARLILASELPGERGPGRPIPAYVDPSTYARQPTSPKPASPNAPPARSIAGIYAQAGLPVNRANNDRLLGVAVVADKLTVRVDGLPRILIYSTCRNLIRTLPTLQRSPTNPEDVDTKGEDHAYDALRYLLLGLGFTAPPERLHPHSPRGTPPTETGRLRKAGF